MKKSYLKPGCRCAYLRKAYMQALSGGAEGQGEGKQGTDPDAKAIFDDIDIW